MLTGLTRYIYAPIAALALWAVILAVSPAMANAQATHQTQDQQEIAVVDSGDSLWSISSRWLGPDATVQQIAGGVERIYALNRDRIGADPNLLLVGQRLVLPSAVERRASEPGSAARKREAAEPMAAPSTTSQAANDGSGNATRAALAEAHREPGQSAEARTEPASLPEPIGATPVPAVRTLSPHDPSPSLAESFATEAGSSFSSVVAAVGEALPRGAVSERKLLGGALIAMSAALAIILALHVAREVLGPRYTRRRAQKRWVRETRIRRNYASLPAFDPREVHGAAYAATEDHPLDGDPQKVAKLALARGLRPRAPSRHSAKGGASTDALRDPATSRGGAESIRRARALEARRHTRRRAKGGAGGLRPSQAHRTRLNRAQRARALRRKEIDVDTGPMGAKANREGEIGERLRRSIKSIPLQPAACERYALSEVKPLAEDALTTMTALERPRRLTDEEHRQTLALQRLLAALQETDREQCAG
jgi:hypothetical protein